MKAICFESYRRSRAKKQRQRLPPPKPQPKQLDPSWYTDNLYSNRSEDLDDDHDNDNDHDHHHLHHNNNKNNNNKSNFKNSKNKNKNNDNEEDFGADCVEYGAYRKLRNILEHEELYAAEGCGAENEWSDSRGRGEGEGSAGLDVQRSTSCRDLQNRLDARGCCPGAGVAERGAAPPPPPLVTSILKNRSQVPKSYSFSASSAKTTPFDVMDYEPPPPAPRGRRRPAGFCCSNSLDEAALCGAREAPASTCCAREHCTSARCLLDDIHAGGWSWRCATPPSASSLCSVGVGGGGGSISSRNPSRLAPSGDWWAEGSGLCAASGRPSCYGREQPAPPPPPAPTVICCCAADDYCCHRQQRHLHAAPVRPRLPCPGHHPAAEEEEHLHCRAPGPGAAYDTDLQHFIRDERERLLVQDKFLDEDERYLSGALPAAYRRPAAASKALLEAQPPSRYDEDEDEDEEEDLGSGSDSTEVDLADFTVDLERYWEELEKPPTPTDLDMQRRNMRSNLKVKDVNVGRYNNGRPIEADERERERERERELIKKSLLEGMPSPPQLGPAAHHAPNNADSFGLFAGSAGSPLRRPLASYGYGYGPAPSVGLGYGHKVYPAADSLPASSFQFNDFYADAGRPVQTQQPGAAGHSAIALLNNIFSIYKPSRYAAHNCQLGAPAKPEPRKKMNVPSTRRPLGAPLSDYAHSTKRPLLVSGDQPHFHIIPEKTGLKISPFYGLAEYGAPPPAARLKLSSTARPLMLPH